MFFNKIIIYTLVLANAEYHTLQDIISKPLTHFSAIVMDSVDEYLLKSFCFDKEQVTA